MWNCNTSKMNDVKQWHSVQSSYQCYENIMWTKKTSKLSYLTSCARMQEFRRWKHFHRPPTLLASKVWNHVENDFDVTSRFVYVTRGKFAKKRLKRIPTETKLSVAKNSTPQLNLQSCTTLWSSECFNYFSVWLLYSLWSWCMQYLTKVVSPLCWLWISSYSSYENWQVSYSIV